MSSAQFKQIFPKKRKKKRKQVQDVGIEVPSVNSYSFTYHLSKPEQSDSNAGIHTKGSKAARKSAFVGTMSSLELTTSKYDAPQNATRTTKQNMEQKECYIKQLVHLAQL